MTAGNNPAGRRVLMVSHNLQATPAHPPPTEYRFDPIDRESIAEWTEVQRDAEPYLTIADTLFEQQFGRDADAIRERCCLLRAPNGRAVGTISAWFDDDFRGECWGRVHWVAIRREAQGRGLAKAMMSHCLATLARWHDKAYLVTQEKRLPAIALYRKFGFEPLLSSDEDRATWSAILAALDARRAPRPRS